MTNGLRGAFARYDREDVKQALKASIALFNRIGKETAHRLNYGYSAEASRKVSEWIEKCL